MKASVVVLTAGGRPAELRRAIESALAQPDAEVLVVSNGAGAIDVAEGARLLVLDDNLGPCGGRNRAVGECGGEVIFFLDDDAAFASDEEVARGLHLFEHDARLGIASFRIEDPTGAPPQRRHVPRLRADDPMRSGPVTTFLEGACAIRRDVFDRCGGYPEEFFFGHEGTDLAWRALDAGYQIRYDAGVVIHHPAEPPTRHDTHYSLTSRNRVFLARRRLPWTVAALYLTAWLVLELVRAPGARARKAFIAGYRDGFRLPCGPRKPMSWRTVWRMTLMGRPPIV